MNILKKIVKPKILLSIVLIVTMITTQFATAFAYNSEKSDYLAIQANNFSMRKGVNINGSVIKGGIEDYSSAMFYLLSGENMLTDTIDVTDDFLIELPVYCENDVDINATYITTNTILASAGTINIKGKKLTSSEIAIIYSKTGDITINCDKMEFAGIIYAPNGKVTIESDDVLLNGCIISDSVKINSSNADILPNDTSEDLLSFIKGYKNEGYMEFHAYIEDGNLGVYCDSNLKMCEGTVYVRYDNDKVFRNVGEFETNEGMIKEFDFDKRIDVIVEGRTIFGEIIESGVISLEKDGEGNINYITQDSDNDGVEDGIEIYYLKSNPNSADTDGDKISDGIEVYNLYTDPTKTNKSNEDFDNDGVNNYDEVMNDSNVYLSDSDFDGVKDKNDKEVRKYKKDIKGEKIKSVTQGRFDKIVTYIDCDGNCVQKVYDFINNKVKMEMEENLATFYYYDYDMNLVSKIVNYNDEIAVNNYEYDDENITAIYNNGYKYGFTYDDDCRIIEVSLNDISLIKYEYLESGKNVVYANGTQISEEISDVHTIAEIGASGGYSYFYDNEKYTGTYEFDNGLVLTYCYNSEGQLKGVEANTGFNIGYDYNKTDTGSISNITYTIDGEVYTQIDTVNYDDEIGKIVASELITGSKVEKYYNEDNEMIESITINDIEYINNITYGENSKVKSIEYSDETNINYSYDKYDNIIMVEENDIVTMKYEYDQLNRLISEIDYTNGTISIMSYDLFDNIKLIEKFEYNNNEVGKLLYSNDYAYSTTYGDQLIGFNGQTITYDESGKPLEYYNDSKFVWEGDRLVRAVVEEKEIEFEHDSNGTVTKKRVNGLDTIYCIEGTDYIAEISSEHTIIYMYDSEANVVGFSYNGEDYYYVKNALKDVIKIMDSNYEVVCSYEYDAWGNITEIDGDKDIAEINKYRYRSYYFDVDMHMYYLHSRYYDATTGRFISSDQIDMMIYNEDNLNLYAYCKNNPILYIDPEGTAIKVQIITLTDWIDESYNIADDFEDYYGEDDIEVSSFVFPTDNMSNLEIHWNSLSAKHYVVINTHGEPMSLLNSSGGNKDEDILTISEIDNLSFKNIRVLILLGCNAGHYDYKWTNVAYAFSKRISGCVIASDGTVYSGGWNHNENSSINTSFSSIDDDEYLKWFWKQNSSFIGVPRPNNGWSVYKYGRMTSTGYLFNGKLGTVLKINTLVNDVVNMNFYASYK